MIYGLALALVAATSVHTVVAQTDRCDNTIQFVNFHAATPDGGVSAFTEGTGCPIALADDQRQVTVDADPQKSHQEYHFSMYGRACGFFGSAAGSYLQCDDGTGTQENVTTLFEDNKYANFPCPSSCDSTCSSLNSDWTNDAKLMLTLKWDPNNWFASSTCDQAETSPASSSPASPSPVSAVSGTPSSGSPTGTPTLVRRTVRTRRSAV